MTNPTWSTVRAAIAESPPGVDVGVSIQSLASEATFGHHDNQVFPAASTIKLVILVALAQAVDDGRLDLTATAPMLGTQRVGGSGVLNWLQPGLQLTLRDHAWLMIAISDNTASNVLIDAVGMPAIHKVQRSVGLRNTSLNRRFLGRLPDPGQPENLATAGDLTRLLFAIDRGSAASPERCDWLVTLLGDQQHRDRLGRNVPEGVTFAGKSGSLPGLAHDIGLYRSPTGGAAVAVLTRGFADPYAADAFIGSVGSAVIADLRIG